MSTNQTFKIPLPTPGIRVFVILVLVIGAALLLTSGIDPQSSIRASLSPTPMPSGTPAPTPNAFAFAGYRPFASADGVIKVEFPDGWRFVADQRGQKTYTFSPDESLSSNVVVQVRIGTKAALIQGLTGATEKSTPLEILTLAFAATGGGGQKVEPARSGSLTGAKTFQPNAPDQNNQPSGQALETWLLSIDDQTIALVQGISPAAQWSQTSPILNKMMETMQIDRARAIATVEFSPSPSTVVAPVAPSGAATPAR